MRHFIVEMYIPAVVDQDFFKMIPAHRAYIDELIAEGKILTYAVNEERSKGWIVFEAKEAEEVLDLVQQFPIHRFLSIEIHALMVHDGESYRFPRLHLN
jgi:muconolactone delta-isomerase